VPLLLVLLTPIVALAQDARTATEAPSSSQSSFTVGVKLWVNSWDSWVTSPLGTGVALGTSRFQTVQSVNSSTKVSVIPSVSYRRGDFFGALSMMTKTSYSLPDAATPGGFDVNASREEVDFNAGYFFLPGVALTLGAKQLTQTYGPDKFRWRGPIVGISGSAGVSEGWALYGTAGIGFMKAKFPTSQSDIYGKTSFNADYRVGEVGLAYTSPLPSSFIKSVVLTVGYRAQYVSTKGYGLAVTDPSGTSTPNTKADLKDTTQGPAVGVVAVF
jgi:hypothetical protein